jgi:hypothetical protein
MAELWKLTILSADGEDVTTEAELIDEEMVGLYCKQVENLAPGSQVWLAPPGECSRRIR